MTPSSVLPQLQRLLDLERIHAPSEPPADALLHRLLATLDAAPVLLSYIDTQYRYRFCNRAYETWFGHPREHYVGRTIPEVLGQKAFTAIRTEVEAALAGQMVRFERVVPYQHGGARTVEASYLPHVLSDGSVAGYVGLVVDITELKSGAEAKRLAGVLEESEARLRMVLEAGSFGTWELDLATDQHRWDARTREIFEAPGDAPVPHEAFLASVCADDLSRVRAGVARARRDGVFSLDADLCVHGWQTGRQRWLAVRGRVHADAAGRPSRILGTVLDITERKRAETRERRLHAAVTALARTTWPEEVGRVLLREAAGALGAASASLVLVSEDGQHLELQAAQGFPEEALAGWRRFPLDTPVMFGETVRERRPVLHMSLASLLTDYPALSGAGESLVGRSFVSVPLLLDEQVVGAMGLSFAREDAFDAEDVFFLQSLAGQGALAVERARLLAAERKARARAEALQAALEAERRQLASVLEHLPVGVMLAEAPSGRILKANPHLDVVLRRPFSTAETVAGYSEAYPARHLDGRPVLPEEWPLARSVQHGETVRGETVELERGDGTHGIVELSSAPILGADGQVAAAVVLVSDVTEQRRNAEALERSVALREQFVSIVSHDLRSPLQAVLTSAALLQQQPEQGPERVRRNATRITASAERMARLIRDLLDLARARSGTLMPLQPRSGVLEDVMRAAVAELEVAYPRRAISLDVEGDTEGLWDADRLEQVVGNLVANALTHGDPEHPVQVHLRAEPERVELSVRNRGRPISPEQLPRLFEPFARGDATGAPSGLGLGLFIVREIVAAHGGQVSARSSEAEGTVFTVVLPRQAA
ncbi:PAS domain-containing sensor histidine kinase [Pyxidicoccus xibeiensis]|uniref:PAS domain-containing sensor histidine kinase n=1 Tax=Pyxidicoccus xibeiensis TaxID=2906759 RepID=UPI0020A70282|nr:PAS domain-containing protein [Pyxidicoccus xibeiensis]MCP3143419.1 PAS domain-containing protein [Pyxidicoccus xibeiensis]